MGTSNYGSAWFFSISLVFYLAAAISYILYTVFKKDQTGKIAMWILVVGLLGHTVALVLRTLEVKYAPFVTIYETLMFWSWLIALAYLLLQFTSRMRMSRMRMLGVLIAPLAFLAIVSAFLLPSEYKHIELSSATYFGISLVLYLAATASYILYAVFRKDRIGKIATWILVVGLLGNTVALVLRTLEAKPIHAPFVTTYEALTFWSWLIALVYLLLQFRFRIRVLGALVTPLAFLAIAAASLLPHQYKQAGPLVPALQSHWLEFHIVTCFIGYACFAVSFAVSLAYLVKQSNDTGALLSKDKLDMIGYKSISLGFPFLTLGIISGAIWANAAWSRYWAWDPKEVWSLITWFIYALYLHLRVIAKWKGTVTAVASIVGFAAVVFTFFGVNFLLSGLHTYG